MEVAGQTAIVTGAGSGIGRATALALAAAGVIVVVAGRTEGPLQETVVAIQRAGGRALAVRADVTREDEVLSLFRVAEEQCGPVATLVTAAGVCHTLKPVTEITLEEWDASMAANARGTFLCAREAARRMSGRRSGNIITISSSVGKKGVATVSAYSASKAAVIGFTQSLADELRPYGVRVQVICPGPVDTPLRWRATPDFDRGKLIAPEEIAEAVLFLVSRGPNVVAEDISLRSVL